MWLKEVSRLFVNRLSTGSRPKPHTQRPCGVRLAVERLDDRTLPSNFMAASVSDLINDSGTEIQSSEAVGYANPHGHPCPCGHNG
jgi:hypothetical protein